MTTHRDAGLGSNEKKKKKPFTRSEPLAIAKFDAFFFSHLLVLAKAGIAKRDHEDVV